MTPLPTTPCERWPKYIGTDGYGRRGPTAKGESPTLAHRWVFAQAHGPIPSGMVVMHLCDNRACVRLDHLALGSQSENLKMAYERGMTVRGAAVFPTPPEPQRGSDHYRARLNADQVLAIRASDESSGVWAARLGVSKSCVKAARSGRTWKHV